MSARTSFLINTFLLANTVSIAANGFSEIIRFEQLDNPQATLSRNEQRILDEWTEDTILFEDFSDHDVNDLQDIEATMIAHGVLQADKDGTLLYYERSSGFTRALVCYRVESDHGHLFTPIHSEDGHYALFNDVMGDWAWIDFENGQQAIREEGFGQPSASNRDQWMVHELRVVGKKLQYLVNGAIFGSVPFEYSQKMRNFAVSANCGGTGVVDYVLIAGRNGPGETLYDFGEAEIVCHDPFVIEALVPATPTTSAPFDTIVTPEGGIVMAGSSGHLVEYNEQNEFRRLEVRNGVNFELTRDGTYWFYNFPDGTLRKWTPESRRMTQVAELPKAYTDGSIAVDQDGRTVYIAWWIRDNDPDLEASALFRYTERRGLEKIVDMPRGVFLRAVEVTPAGKVFVATTKGIAELGGGGAFTTVLDLKGAYVTSDGLTSDSSGNLYYTAHAGEKTGLFRLSPAGQTKQIAVFPQEGDLPFGLSFNEISNEVIGVRKEAGELVAMDMFGVIRTLNNPTGLTTPISVGQHPDGEIFVNGDESGLLRITSGGRVERFTTGMCSYQPPAADFAFDSDGIIYYCEAAPGFESAISRIDEKGNRSVVTTQVEQPAGIDIAVDGSIYYADYGRHAVMRLNLDSEDEVVQSGIPFPVGLVVDDEGSFWVSAAEEGVTGDPASIEEISPRRILRFRPGEGVEEIIGPESGIDSTFTFFDVDADGTLYLPAGHRLLVRKKTGEIEIAAEGFRNVRGAAVCQDGSIVVSDYEQAALYRIRRR